MWYTTNEQITQGSCDAAPSRAVCMTHACSLGADFHCPANLAVLFSAGSKEQHFNNIFLTKIISFCCKYTYTTSEQDSFTINVVSSSNK